MQLSQLEHWTGMPQTQVRFPCAARDFSPRVNFQCRLSYGVRTPLCTSVHMLKHPIVHVRVWWIMETLKHPACTLGWVAQLCCSWLSLGKATQISHGRNPIGTILVVKSKVKVKYVEAVFTLAQKCLSFLQHFRKFYSNTNMLFFYDAAVESVLKCSI